MTRQLPRLVVSAWLGLLWIPHQPPILLIPGLLSNLPTSRWTRALPLLKTRNLRHVSSWQTLLLILDLTPAQILIIRATPLVRTGQDLRLCNSDLGEVKLLMVTNNIIHLGDTLGSLVRCHVRCSLHPQCLAPPGFLI